MSGPTIEVRFPEVAEGITSATLIAWLKREGGTVRAGEPIAEVETEKTTFELEAPVSGVLGKIYVPSRTEGVTVGTLLAVIVPTSDADHPQLPTQANSDTTIPHETPSISTPRRISEEQSSSAARPSSSVYATRLARRMAELADLDLSSVRPSATSGRITREDIEAALRHRKYNAKNSGVNVGSKQPLASAAPFAPPAPAADATFADRPLSTTHRAMAGRMQLAKQTIPHFYLQVDYVVETLIRRRAEINAAQHDVNVTITEFIVLATALALRRVPLANSAWIQDTVRVYDNVDIAVAVDTPKGLITPVVQACQRKSLLTISRQLGELVRRARRGALMPGEYTGGTFTISNLGMFGVTGVIPIINPPHSCILGVGAIEKRPVVREGQLTICSMMSCTLAADHRVIDGKTGANLLSEIRRLLEDPVLMEEDGSIGNSTS